MTDKDTPAEEIERYQRLIAHDRAMKRTTIMISIDSLHALLAEIVAGRAGAERVRELEAALGIEEDEDTDPVALVKSLHAAVAALRQAAQPSDGVTPAFSANDWRHGCCTHSAPSRGHCPKCGVALPTDPAAPAQVGAQPAGRAKIIEKLRTAKNWLNGGSCCGQVDSGGTCAAPGCIFGEACKWMHAAAEALSAIPPTAGAVDDGEG